LEEKNLIEQEANAIIDDIKEAEEKIKTLMEVGDNNTFTQYEIIATGDR